ncbi:variable surface protein [Plasmodium gonderi]|uniref:Variable surface protein n=1 Tax=Plasmodium gonderi TaxID=77519 RepID=A0A1Y1JV28_PLAGO|nr:variable surface protein [Plasmodium gonderi]GAW84602.1 variable surface protein [Plasmodium gonderi]
MDAKITLKDDLKGIFPTCMDDFDTHSRHVEKINVGKNENTCIVITRLLGVTRFYSLCFISQCKELIHYLDYINNAESDIIKPSCVYFNYKLKVLLKYYKSPKKINDAYDIMINTGSTRSSAIVSNICKGKHVDLDDGTFFILDKLNKLYHIVKNKIDVFPFSSDCYNIYMDLSNICDKGKNVSFHELLNDFKHKYIKHEQVVIAQLGVHEVLHYTFGKHERIIILVLCIIPVTIIMITFFMYKFKYKYNTYGSFLQLVLIKLRRILNRKKEDYLIIVNSFEETYNEFIRNEYHISNSSLDCP